MIGIISRNHIRHQTHETGTVAHFPVLFALGGLCSRVRPLWYASILVLLPVMLWVGYCCYTPGM